MRELITIEFIDMSNYSDNTTEDVIGVVMPHVWGPVDKLTPVEYSKFMQLYPQLNSPGWIKASQAFQAGAGMCEILRPQLTTPYQMIVVTDKGFQTVTGLKQFNVNSADLNGEKNLAVFSMLYPGSPKGTVDAVELLLEPVYDEEVETPTPSDVPIDVMVTVTCLDANGNEVETNSGLMISTELIDGQSVNIGQVLKKKSYYVRYQLNDGPGLIAREQLVDTGAASISDITLRVAKDEATYNEYVDSDYRDQYDYEASKDSLPWVICSFTRPSGVNTPFDLTLKAQGAPSNVTFGGTSSKVGTVSEDGKSIKCTASKYVMFDVVADLGLTKTDVNFTGVLTVNGRELNLDTSNPDPVVPQPDNQPENDYVMPVMEAKVPVIGTEEESDITITELITLYTKYFSHMETSRSTILLPTVCDAQLENALIQIAAQRSECLALLGYPETEDFTEEAIQAHYNKLTKDKFGLFYAGRDVVTVGDKEVASDCLGTIAGRYAAVANDETINQIPSAQSFGSYPGTLLETLDNTAVLALQKLGINSVYSAYTGPQIWGVKSMYSRQSGYWAKANVMRVVTQLLSTTMDFLMGVFHTPNTTAKKASVQNNRQAYLNNLIATGVLREQSTCQCDADNNKDIDTNGGEILIVDFDIWFVKLIERVHIRITASDDTTTVLIS